MNFRNTICFIFFCMMIPSVIKADEPRATILLYHGLTEKTPASMYEKRKERFYRDMEYIRDNFDVISLLELQDIIENKRTLSRNSVVITFDDGMLSNYNIAVPILKEFGFPATFFIVSDFPENDDWFMTWEQIKELSQVKKDGEYLFTIGSHSCSHQYPGLQNLTGAALRRELEDSKNAIDQHITPRVCTSFAVPYGILPPNQTEFYSLMTELGYEIIRTSENDNVYIETADLLNLPCLPLYNFTEPEYIGAFNQNPISTPYFDPPQDVYSQYSPASFDVLVTGIASYFSWNSWNITIEAVPENNDMVASIQIIRQPPWDVATIRIITKEGVFGRAKINVRITEPGTHPSSDYFYVNIEDPTISRATILLYHGFTEKSPTAMYEKRKDRFYRDMEYIRDNFDVISLSELQDIIKNKRTLSRNAVVITFDDGMYSNFTIAAPILKEFGFPATFFIVANFPDNDDWFMKWHEIRELSQVKKNGEYLFTIGSHGYSHEWPGLQDLTGTALRHELEDSKKAIDRNIAPRVCTSFAIPYGILPPNPTEFYSLMAELGYEIIRTSENNNVYIETADLLNLPCLPLYDFTEPEYIGAFNQKPISTPFFDPVQDVYLEYNHISYTVEVPITGITSYFSGDSRNITIESTSENNNMVQSVQVIHQSPWNVATIRITTKARAYGQAKINILLTEPSTHPSSGYFYVNVEPPISEILYIYPNPAKDYIQIMNADAYINYSIYNTLGQSLKNGQGNKIDIGFLPQGIYIINIGYDKKTTQLKFIKN